MAVKKGPPKSGGAKPKKGQFKDPLSKWGGPDSLEQDLEKLLKSAKKERKTGDGYNGTMSAVMSKFNDMTSVPLSLRKKISDLEKLLRAPNVPHAMQAQLRAKIAKTDEQLQKALHEVKIEAKKAGTNYLAQEEVLARLTFVKGLLTSGKALDVKTARDLKRMQALLSGVSDQLDGAEIDTDLLKKLLRRASKSDDILENLDKETKKDWSEFNKVLSVIQKQNLADDEERQKQRKKHRVEQKKAAEDIKKQREFWKSVRGTIEEKFLDISKHIGLGFANVANVYKVGKFAYKAAKFVGNKRFRLDAINNSILGKGKNFIRNRAAAKRGVAKLAPGMAEHLEPGARPQANAIPINTGNVDVNALGDQEQPQAGVPGEAEWFRANAAKLDNVLDAVGGKKQKESLTDVADAIHEASHENKKFHRGALDFLGKIGKAGEEGGAGILTALSGMAGAILPFLAVAGSFIGAWKIGKELYEKNATAIQDGLDKLTGGKSAAAGKEATADSVMTRPMGTKPTSPPVTPPEGGGGTSGGAGASGSSGGATPTATGGGAPAAASDTGGSTGGAKPVTVSGGGMMFPVLTTLTPSCKELWATCPRTTKPPQEKI